MTFLVLKIVLELQNLMIIGWFAYSITGTEP